MYGADGTPLQAVPAAMPEISQAPGAFVPQTIAPAAVWTGHSWFVASVDTIVVYNGIPEPLPTPTTLFGAVLSESGDEAGSPMRLGLLPLQGIDTGVAWNGHVVMAGNGQGGVLSTPDGNTVRQLPHVYPLTSAGGTFLVHDSIGNAAILDGSGDLVRTLSLGWSVRAAAAHGDEYGLLVAASGGYRFVTLDSAGNLKSERGFPISFSVSGAAMTWSGGSYVIGYYGYVSASVSSRLCLSRTDDASASRCMDGGGVSGIALAANDRKLLVAWNLAEHFIQTVFADAGGLPDLGSAADATTHPQQQLAPSIVRDDRGVTVGWWREDGSVLAGGVDADGHSRTPRVLGTSSTYGPPRLSRGRTSTLAVWGGGSAPAHVYAQELPDGRLIDLGAGSAPAVAFDGDGWMVVWVANTGSPLQLLSALVHPGEIGATAARAVLPSPRSQFAPALASRGGDFLVVWQEDQHPGGFATKAALADRSGVATGSEFDVVDRPYGDGLAVAASSGMYFICVLKTGLSSFSVATLSPDILLGTASLSGAPALLRVHDRAEGGFALLWGFAPSALRFISLSTRGDIVQDAIVPRAISQMTSNEADFLDDRGRLTLVYGSHSWFPRLFLETFTFRRRAVGMR
jgi:hypothetical protein